jgi:dTDP-4-dehydrorhamnose reductase
MNRHAKILVTGANGLLGSQIVNILKKKNYKKIYTTNSKNLNLLNYKIIDSFFKKK